MTAPDDPAGAATRELPLSTARHDLVSAALSRLLGDGEAAEQAHHRARQKLYAAGHTLDTAQVQIWASHDEIEAEAVRLLLADGIDVPDGYQGRRIRCECQAPAWNAWERCCALCGGRIVRSGGTS